MGLGDGDILWKLVRKRSKMCSSRAGALLGARASLAHVWAPRPARELLFISLYSLFYKLFRVNKPLLFSLLEGEISLRPKSDDFSSFLLSIC